MPRAKKTAAKKTAAKKTAAKKTTTQVRPLTGASATKVGKERYVYDIMSDDTFSSNLAASLEVIGGSKVGTTTDLINPEQDNNRITPFNNLVLEYLTGLRGLRDCTIVEIIGAEGIGKSHLSYILAGSFTLSGCPSAIFECENKLMFKSRATRCLSTNPKLASKIYDRISHIRVRTQSEFYHKLKTWLMSVREVVPKEVPVVCIADPYSSLCDKKEAAAVDVEMLDGLKKVTANSKDTEVELTEGSNFNAAKFNQELKRRMQILLDAYNASIVFMNHQNEHVAMTGVKKGVLRNDTTRGGGGIKQCAALRLIAGYHGLLKSGDTNVGKVLNIRCHKNSFGPEERVVSLDLIMEGLTDVPADTATGFDGILAPAVDWSSSLAGILVEHSVFGTTVKAKRYTSTCLGLEGVTAKVLWDTLYADPNLVAEAARFLGIYGYEVLPEEIEELSVVALPPSEENIVTTYKVATLDAELPTPPNPDA